VGPFQSVLIGLAGLGALWVVLGIASSFNLKKLICGSDNSLSTSKFQLVLWTVVIVFSYLVMFSFLGKAKNFADLGLPDNVLIVMGISATTAIAAKGIAVSNASAAAKAVGTPIVPGAGTVVVSSAAGSAAGLFQGDDGMPDLGKVQLMIWTLIGICIYLTKVHHQLVTQVRIMPDIDQTLMVLMGLGHGAYLGKKIAGNGGS
jgi:hypothetical protein